QGRRHHLLPRTPLPELGRPAARRLQGNGSVPVPDQRGAFHPAYAHRHHQLAAADPVNGFICQPPCCRFSGSFRESEGLLVSSMGWSLMLITTLLGCRLSRISNVWQSCPWVSSPSASRRSEFSHDCPTHQRTNQALCPGDSSLAKWRPSDPGGVRAPL